MLKGNPTLRELLLWLKNKGLNAYSISYGSCLLYSCMLQRHAECMDKNMVDLVVDVAKAELSAYMRHFDIVVACEDEDNNEVDIPLVYVYFK